MLRKGKIGLSLWVFFVLFSFFYLYLRDFDVCVTPGCALLFRFLEASGLRINALGRFPREVVEENILLAMSLCFQYLEGGFWLILLDLTNPVYWKWQSSLLHRLFLKSVMHNLYFNKSRDNNAFPVWLILSSFFLFRSGKFSVQRRLRNAHLKIACIWENLGALWRETGKDIHSIFNFWMKSESGKSSNLGHLELKEKGM